MYFAVIFQTNLANPSKIMKEKISFVAMKDPYQVSEFGIIIIGNLKVTAIHFFFKNEKIKETPKSANQIC